MTDITKQVNEYYENALAQFGSGARGVGWKNEDSQLNRFLQLLKIIGNDGFEINDLGCGTGNLLPFLREHFKNFHYVGYDILEKMIGLAKRAHGEIDKAEFILIKDASEMRVADYTVASGIFNLKYETPVSDWLKKVLETLNEMHEHSTRGFSFNMLTSYSDPDFMEGHLYYADPLFIFDHCKKHFSKNVALLHDYYEYDFTILVRK